jgi:hypothetical protein
MVFQSSSFPIPSETPCFSRFAWSFFGSNSTFTIIIVHTINALVKQDARHDPLRPPRYSAYSTAWYFMRSRSSKNVPTKTYPVVTIENKRCPSDMCGAAQKAILKFKLA